MIVGIIPAKGKSKGIPGKNMKRFGGHPLIQWTINAAKRSERLDHIFVSTEDPAIKQNALSQNLQVLTRPPELSEDSVQVDEVMLFALRQLQWSGLNPSVVVVLQPTSPFRTAKHIDEAIDLYHEVNEGKRLFALNETVFSVYQPEKFHYKTSRGLGVPLGHNPEKRLGRQDTDPTEVVVENGAIYVVDADRLSNERTMRPTPMVPYTMGYWESLELDNELDWEIATHLLENRELMYADHR
ncbi:MAG: acylneuraminate cytidylyltransferase family protein [Planctomycetota bacterium]|jgi:CMP-N-acetylneuraminic acid synthetase